MRRVYHAVCSWLYRRKHPPLLAPELHAERAGKLLRHFRDGAPDTEWMRTAAREHAVMLLRHGHWSLREYDDYMSKLNSGAR